MDKISFNTVFIIFIFGICRKQSIIQIPKMGLYVSVHDETNHELITKTKSTQII